MKKTMTTLLVIVSLISISAAAFAEQLDAETQQALIEALNDEYKAKALYQKVLEKFGDVRPFANVIRAEETHIQELLPLFQKYGVEAPEDNWAEKVPEFESLQAACEAGVKAEIENAAMYDEFFSFVQEGDIRDTFTLLRDASQDKHLPAFQRCTERESSTRGAGRQQSPGRGRGRKN